MCGASPITYHQRHYLVWLLLDHKKRICKRKIVLFQEYFLKYFQERNRIAVKKVFCGVFQRCFFLWMFKSFFSASGAWWQLTFQAPILVFWRWYWKLKMGRRGAFNRHRVDFRKETNILKIHSLAHIRQYTIVCMYMLCMNV